MKEQESPLPEELMGILENAVEATRSKADTIYAGEPDGVAKSALHSLAHETLEEAFDKMDVDKEIRMNLRRELAPILHRLVEKDKV